MPTSTVRISDTSSRAYVRAAAVGPTLLDLDAWTLSDLDGQTLEQIGAVPAGLVRLGPMASVLHGPPVTSMVRVAAPGSVLIAGLKGPTNTLEAMNAYTLAELDAWTLAELDEL